jgi:hypothetical protein
VASATPSGCSLRAPRRWQAQASKDATTWLKTLAETEEISMKATLEHQVYWPPTRTRESVDCVLKWHTSWSVPSLL